MKKNIWLDTDPGIDDLFAIIMCCYHPNANLIGVSSVTGNLGIETTTQNTLDILHMIGKDHIPVIKGAHVPLMRDVITCPEIHGEILGTIGMKKSPNNAITKNPFYEIYSRIMAFEGKVTVCSIGPLTNFAIIFKAFPDIKEKIEHFYFLGGGIFAGNITSLAEFNAFGDPHAFQMVLNEHVPMTVVPLEPCLEVPIFISNDFMPEGKSRLYDYLHDFLNTIIKNSTKFGENAIVVIKDYHSPTVVYDPLLVCSALEEGCAEKIKVHAEIELSSPLSFGMMVVQRSKQIPANINLVVKIDRETFIKTIKNCIEEANKFSPYN